MDNKTPDFTDKQLKRLGDMFRRLSKDSGSADAETLMALRQIESVLKKNGTTFEHIAQHPEWLTGAAVKHSAELETLCKDFEAANQSLAAQNDAVIAENAKLRAGKKDLEAQLQAYKDKEFSTLIAPEGKIREGNIVEFNFPADADNNKIFLRAQESTRARTIDATDNFRNLHGWDKVRILGSRGALYNDVEIDGTTHPAIQAFDLKTGQRTCLLHYRNGLQNDGVDGDPAVQEFDRTTGQRTALHHYKTGRLNDSADGDPAVQHFDAQTGLRTYLGRYLNGAFNDSADGDPAVQHFNEQTGLRRSLFYYMNGKRNDRTDNDPAVQYFDTHAGLIIDAASWKNGVYQKQFSAQELNALNRAKGLLPPAVHRPRKPAP